MNDLFKSLTFQELTAPIENYGKDYASYWGCALAGEVGEVCNKIKKFERDGKLNKKDLGEELADVFIYTVLTARYFDINLEIEIRHKLSILKERKHKKEMAMESFGTQELYCSKCEKATEARDSTIDGDGGYDETGPYLHTWLACPICDTKLRARKEESI